MAEFYYNKATFTSKQLFIYTLTGAYIYKEIDPAEVFHRYLHVEFM